MTPRQKLVIRLRGRLRALDARARLYPDGKKEQMVGRTVIVAQQGHPSRVRLR